MAEGHGVAESASATISTSKIANSSFRCRVDRFRWVFEGNPLSDWPTLPRARLN